MSTYQKGTSQYLQILVLDKLGNIISGLNPEDITISIYRNSDNAYLDSDTNTFISSGGNSEFETSEMGNLGIYRILFDQSVDDTDNEHYTIIYNIKQPFTSRAIENITFRDVNLDDIKGAGWDSASNKPTLMNIANKNSSFNFNSLTHSLERLAELQQLNNGENFNTEAI